MAVRAITFDFWRTLFRDRFYAERQRIRIEALAQATGRDEARIDQALIEVWQEFERHHREEQRTLLPHDAVKMAAARLDAGLEDETVNALAHIFATAILQYSPAPIEGAVEAVRAAAAHAPLAIISDTGVSPGSSLKVLLERHGILDCFAAFAFSDEVGVSKPQAPMFEKVAAEMNVGVDEMLHIGDLEYTDIRGARALGAQAALFAGENDAYREGTTADYIFDSWDDFVRLLPTLCANGTPDR